MNELYKAIAKAHPSAEREVFRMVMRRSDEILRGIDTPRTMTLEDIRKDLGECIRCPLHRERTNIVFGVGDPAAKVLIVGEGPGENEDLQGEPFVGAAGHLLNRLLEKAGLSRKGVYIANVMKCRPPDNRDPKSEEVRACLPFLKAQYRALGPLVVVTLGKHATQHVAGVYGAMGALLEEELTCTWEGTNTPVIALYHPAYILRQGKGEKAGFLLRNAVNRLKRAAQVFEG